MTYVAPARQTSDVLALVSHDNNRRKNVVPKNAAIKRERMGWMLCTTATGTKSVMPRVQDINSLPIRLNHESDMMKTFGSLETFNRISCIGKM